MGQTTKKTKNNLADQRSVHVILKDLDAAIEQNTSCEEVKSIKECLAELIVSAENRIADLKRQRIAAIEAEIAQLKKERESLK